MTELKNELLEIRGALNYAYLDNKIKKELYDNLINRTEKALDLCVVVGQSEQLLGFAKWLDEETIEGLLAEPEYYVRRYLNQ